MADESNRNLTQHTGAVTRAHREALHGHKGATLWFTGLSGAGKSTVAMRVESLLVQRGHTAYVLDGDNVRLGLNKDLGFSTADRDENIRRVAEVAKLFTDAGVLVLTSFISPHRKERDAVRASMAAGDFLEVYVAADLATCESRDPKGLYKRARAGEIAEFTGVSAPYEEPLAAELVVDTTKHDPDACAAQVLRFLEERGYIPQSR
ncbi:MAG: adenylyl-sulfate kinase [Sandaracinaceae bacterium]|nr:adenylyl-sulfate kinase [Sandaracinaceae bacterium]